MRRTLKWLCRTYGRNGAQGLNPGTLFVHLFGGRVQFTDCHTDRIGIEFWATSTAMYLRIFHRSLRVDWLLPWRKYAIKEAAE